MRLVRHVAYVGGENRYIQVLLRTEEGKEPLGRPRYRSEVSVKMVLQRNRWDGVDRIGLI
jgi:hypothetical protein